MIYSLPHTQVRVAVTFEKTDFSNAPYADYANDMLGLTHVSKDSIYSIKHLEVSSINQADPQHYYFVKPGRFPIHIDNRGLLISLGKDRIEDMPQEENEQYVIGSTTAASRAEYNLYDRSDTFYTRQDKPGHPSLVSSKKDVRTTHQQAMAVAEQIQEIQEKKQELLFGEYEGNYNGDAIQFIFNRLSQKEEELISLFSGSRQEETVVFLIDPKDEKSLIDSQTVEIFRFSPTMGIVSDSSESISIQCEIRCENQLRRASRFIRYRTKSVKRNNTLDHRTFKYRIPETATVRIFAVSDDDEELFSFSTQVKVSQFGTIANMPMGRYEARFDSHTGDLIYFKK